jgi:hypothetical protein
VRWHRAGFRCYWRWKSLPRGGRPQIHTQLRGLIHRMSVENPSGVRHASMTNFSNWGWKSRSPASPSTCSNDRRRPARDDERSCESCPRYRRHGLVRCPDHRLRPALLVIIRLDRRDLVWISVTAHPTAEWVARQITEAFPWNESPPYMIRDHDSIYGVNRHRSGTLAGCLATL